jgi:hypothetical protein
MLYISCALVVMYLVPFGPDLCDAHGTYTHTHRENRERARASGECDTFLSRVSHVAKLH